MNERQIVYINEVHLPLANTWLHQQGLKLEHASAQVAFGEFAWLFLLYLHKLFCSFSVFLFCFEPSGSWISQSALLTLRSAGGVVEIWEGCSPATICNLWLSVTPLSVYICRDIYMYLVIPPDNCVIMQPFTELTKKKIFSCDGLFICSKIQVAAKLIFTEMSEWSEISSFLS